MSDRYVASGAQTVTGTPGDSVLGVAGVATDRGRIYDLIFGAGGTPADNVLEWLARRFSAAGTSTAVTPTSLDPDAPAANMIAGENHTVEPTYTADSEVLHFDLNQRATFRWVAAPNGELVIPATAANGIGVAPISSGYSGDVNVTAHWEE